MPDKAELDMSADGLPPLRDVIARYDLAAKKGLGQHFLLDLNLTGRIARGAGDLSSGTTIEIGPGPGGLTRALLAAGAGRLVVVERDRRCLPALADIGAAYPGRLEVVEADALEVRLADLGPAPRRVVANLPYNVSTALLVRWLEDIRSLDGLTLMFQKEVVDRVVAREGSRTYGRLSVLTQWLCTADPLFDIDPRAFTPPPKVQSTVVRLEPRRDMRVSAEQFTAMERLTAAAFGQRRKMLRRSLSALCGGADAASTLCAAAGIDPQARAETVPISGFAALVERL